MMSVLPDSVSMEQIIQALTAASSSSSNPLKPTLEQVQETLAQPFRFDTLVTSSHHNSQNIICAYCLTPILNKDVAIYENKTVQIHAALSHQAPQRSLQHLWKVQGQLSFENVGVTRAISLEDDPSSCKYLVCGECDQGPIGITWSNEPEIFFVAHGLISYS